MIAEELTYRQERYSWQGEVYWQRVQPPWGLVTTLRGVNISRSGLLAEGNAQALTSIFADAETVLQLNGEDCHSTVEAVLVRRQEQLVAFSFTTTDSELDRLLTQIRDGR